MQQPQDILCFEVMDTSRMSFFGGGSSSNVDKSKYEHLTLSIKQTVLERARYRCHNCSKKFGPSSHPHFEHINGSLKDNRPTNLRPLCSECFKPIEKKETKKGGLLGNMRNTIGGMFQK
jgi:5-methylcytosine-specific restriction endonuclease McrA